MAWEEIDEKKAASEALWLDNWDDDVNDEFMEQLRAQVKANGAGAKK